MNQSGTLEDIGDELWAEIKGKNLNDTQRKIVLEYFWQDYTCSFQHLREITQGIKELNPDLSSYKILLSKARSNLIRATKSAHRSRKVSKEEHMAKGRTYKQIFESLIHYARRVYFATEFPKHYPEVYDIFMTMNGAANMQNFELAIIQRDKILELIRNEELDNLTVGFDPNTPIKDHESN